MQVLIPGKWPARMCRIPCSHAKLAILLVYLLSLGGCCADCVRLSQVGAASYSGPATTSGSNPHTPKQGSSGGPSTETPHATLGMPAALVTLPAGAQAVGSAFYLNPKGALLTTWEEVRSCRKIAILVDYEFRDATVVASNPLSGLAVLHAGIFSSAHAIFRTTAVVEGEEISAFAHPILDGISLPLDSATGVARSSTSPDGIRGIVQDSAILDGEAAGGPIVDERGDVVGIIVRRVSNGWPSDVGYGISNSMIFKFCAAAGVEISERAPAGYGSGVPGKGAAPYAGDYTVPVICFR